MANTTIYFQGPAGPTPIKVTDNSDGTYSLQVSTIGGDETVQDLVVTGTMDVAGVATLSGATTVDDALHVTGDTELDGALNHDGTTVGLFGVAPTTRTTGIAQLTDNTGGTANSTLGAIPDPADTPITADALRDDLVANTLPPIRDDLADLAAKLNVVMTALKSLGIIGV